ncbi:hypothetical protein F7725_003034, partial [Dissostichus mawsoni]
FAATHSHSAAWREAQHSAQQNNEKLPRPKGQRNPPHHSQVRFYYMARMVFVSDTGSQQKQAQGKVHRGVSVEPTSLVTCSICSAVAYTC